MRQILYFVICFVVVSCGLSSNEQTPNSSWEYHPGKNKTLLDHQCQPILFQYQEILKALKSKDTGYLFSMVNQSVQLNDSLSSLDLGIDSTESKIWKDGVENINAELKAILYIEQRDNWEEYKMSINMYSIQLLNLLGKIGYKEHQLYIFKSNTATSADEYIWLGLQKESKDPYNADQRKWVTAHETLQEAAK